MGVAHGTNALGQTVAALKTDMAMQDVFVEFRGTWSDLIFHRALRKSEH